MIKQMKQRYFFCSTLALLPLVVGIGAIIVSQEAQTKEIVEFYNSTHALGMGEAYTALAEDSTALYYNPAGIAKTHKPGFKLIDLEGTLNTVVTNYITNPLTAITFKGLADVFAQSSGQPAFSRVQLTPHFMAHNISVGLMARYTGLTYATTGGAVQVSAYTDVGLTGGLGFRLLGGILKMGASGKVLLRSEIDKQVSVSDLNNPAGLMQYANEGIGVGFDLGAIITLPIRTFPTFAAVWHDVGRTQFNRPFAFLNPVATGVSPTALFNVLTVGYSMTFILTPGVTLKPALELRDVLSSFSQSDVVNAYSGISSAGARVTDYLRLAHGGMEFSLFQRLFLRGGLHQGYWTAGLGLNALNSTLDFAAWGEEIGDFPDRKEDRRYSFKYTYTF